MISDRTKVSLCFYLSLHGPEFLRKLFDRQGMTKGRLEPSAIGPNVFDLTNDINIIVYSATPEQLLELLEYMVKTSLNMRYQISPRYRHDELLNDLYSCLQLDGYKIEDNDLFPFEPSIEGVEPLEDDLTKEIKQSRLSNAEDIIKKLQESADNFRRPDYDGCLHKSRVALETLAKSIASVRKMKHPGTYDENKWGSVLSYLKTSGLISEDEEKGLAGVYSFASTGAHRIVGLSEMEMARLGRNLVASMCYFLVKLHNNS